MPSKKNTSRKKRSKKKSGATRHSERKSSFVNWMILFVLIGIFAAFLVYLDKMPTSGKENEQTENTIESQPGQNTNKSLQAEKRPPEHQFDFYTVLPDREIEVNVYEEDEPPPGQPATKQPSSRQSDDSTKTPAVIATTKSTGTPAKPPVADTKKRSAAKSNTSVRALYQLQVGAFKDLDKADAMKARLAFMGVESNIYMIRNANGQKIYRLRVGPNSDEKKLSRIQQQLKTQNINTFMQKLKG